jgi:hypothetical protein
MLVKILGLIDIVAGIVFFVYSVFHIEILSSLILLLAFALLIKGIFFGMNFNITSLIDIAFAFLLFYSLANQLPLVISIIVCAYLLQKGIFSLLH